jgi:uncharacterized protein (DUF2336 family)
MDFPELSQELDDAFARGTPERRTEILKRITDVFVAGSASYSGNQVELFDDIFVRVSKAIEQSARATLANRLAKLPRAPSGISRALASDDEIDVAGPLLEHSSQIDNDTLLAAARTKGQEHLLAISRRSAIDESITDVLLERGDKPVVLSTASNPTARFSESGYSTLVERSAGDDELTVRVALRPDIPREHLSRLLVRASYAVQLKLEAALPAMGDMIHSAVAEAATMILDNANTLSRDYAMARAHVEALHRAGHLAEKDVVTFAAAGQFEETTVALVVLSGLPIEPVDRAMTQDRPDALLVMTKAVGMSWPTARAILRMRAGARGISPGELEQCLAIFTRLKSSTARQAIEYQNKRFTGSRFSRNVA